jgi:hypothetical protein
MMAIATITANEATTLASASVVSLVLSDLFKSTTSRFVCRVDAQYFFIHTFRKIESAKLDETFRFIKRSAYLIHIPRVFLCRGRVRTDRVIELGAHGQCCWVVWSDFVCQGIVDSLLGRCDVAFARQF